MRFELESQTMFCSACLLRTKRPEPIRATAASPDFGDDEQLRNRLWEAASRRGRRPSSSAQIARETLMAGASRKTTPVSTVTTAVKASTRVSKIKSIEALPRNGGRNDHKAFRPQ